MSGEKVSARVITVLGQIQADSGLECPPLNGASKPIEDLPQFDSKVWPVAMTLIASELGTPIPNDMNIFVDPKTKQPLSIDQVAGMVLELRTQEKTAA